MLMLLNFKTKLRLTYSTPWPNLNVISPRSIYDPKDPFVLLLVHLCASVCNSLALGRYFLKCDPSKAAETKRCAPQHNIWMQNLSSLFQPNKWWVFITQHRAQLLFPLSLFSLARFRALTQLVSALTCLKMHERVFSTCSRCLKEFIYFLDLFHMSVS